MVQILRVNHKTSIVDLGGVCKSKLKGSVTRDTQGTMLQYFANRSKKVIHKCSFLGPVELRKVDC